MCVVFGRCRGLEPLELEGRLSPRLALKPQLGVEAELEAQDAVEAVLEKRHLLEDEVGSPHLSHRLDRLPSRFPWAMHPSKGG